MLLGTGDVESAGVWAMVFTNSVELTKTFQKEIYSDSGPASLPIQVGFTDCQFAWKVDPLFASKFDPPLNAIFDPISEGNRRFLAD